MSARQPSRLSCYLAAGIGLGLGLQADAAPPPFPEAKLLPFVGRHCVDCHDGAMRRGDLDLEALSTDLGEPATAARWARVHDMLATGEMPPKKKRRPDANEARDFLENLSDSLVAADRFRDSTEGRATWRRLNRHEYENTVRELLGAPWLQLKDMLPEDGEAHRFNKTGEALDISHIQMSRYLHAADAALRAVVAAGPVPPVAEVRRHYAREQPHMVGKMKFNPFNRASVRATFPMLGTKAQPEVIAGKQPRYPSLTLGVNVKQGARSLSWTGTGVLVPCEESAAAVFRRLFLEGSPEEIASQQRKLQLGKSIMDAVAGQVSGLKRKVGDRDRERLDQYFTGVRDLEKRLEQNREWEGMPKPKVDAEIPIDAKDPTEYMKKVAAMYDLARLAFETDSTRMITLMLDSASSPAIHVDGKAVSDGYHNLSHHGKSPEKLAQLERIDLEHMKLLNALINDLGSVREDQQSLIDRTMVLYGSNMGNANTHVTSNLPVIFAGGGFKHGQHLAFDTTRNYPLPNLYVSMLQRLGIETDKFASSTGTMRGLEAA